MYFITYDLRQFLALYYSDALTYTLSFFICDKTLHTTVSYIAYSWCGPVSIVKSIYNTIVIIFFPCGLSKLIT